MDIGPALTGGGPAGAIGAAVGVARTGWVNAVGAWATWAASAGDAAAAWAVSNAGVAGAPASAIGPANGGGAEWTGLVAAVEIASALADMGTPVWLPELKLCARSVGDTGVGVWGVPIGLPALGAVAEGEVRPAGVSMPGVAGAAAVEGARVGAVAAPWDPMLVVGTVDVRPLPVAVSLRPTALPGGGTIGDALGGMTAGVPPSLRSAAELEASIAWSLDS